jgi:hypothetical protein
VTRTQLIRTQCSKRVPRTPTLLKNKEKLSYRTI